MYMLHSRQRHLNLLNKPKLIFTLSFLKTFCTCLLPSFMYVHHMSVGPTEARTGLDLLELELPTAVSYQVGAEN